MMGQTATEKIIEDASDGTNIKAGDSVEVEVDVSWVHETQLDIFRQNFEELGGRVWNRDKAMLMIDHFPNPSSQEQADRLKSMREYARKKNINLVEVGIKHQAWRTLGIARPGAIMAGPDSHTPTAGALGAFATCVGPTDTAVIWNNGKTWINVPPTIRFEITGDLSPSVTPRDVGFDILERFSTDTSYFADGMTVEYTGQTIRNLSLDGRQTLCNMGTEMGVTNAYIEPDSRLKEEYLIPRVDEEYTIHRSDSDADFVQIHQVDVSDLTPKVAYPHSPSKVHDISEAEGIEIDRLFLGSCANGHYEDLQLAASILEGEQLHPDVDMIVTPATDEIRKRASNTDILDTFIQAGARVSSNYCSACPGYEGVLSEGEVCLSTSTRNYQGRMGHHDSEVYLASPAVTAASAVKGEITTPQEILS